LGSQRYEGKKKKYFTRPTPGGASCATWLRAEAAKKTSSDYQRCGRLNLRGIGKKAFHKQKVCALISHSKMACEKRNVEIGHRVGGNGTPREKKVG